MEEKKESWIETLIELLNEYVEKHNKSDLYYTFELEKDSWWLFCYDDVTDHKWWTMQDEAMVIISKKFWFIKWLVDNDKIDRDKELKENWLFRKYFYDLEYVKNYDRLVMWLSVEDEPIQFLISILK